LVISAGLKACTTYLVHPTSGSGPRFRSVDVEGNKNAALSAWVACLLTTEECTLTNTLGSRRRGDGAVARRRRGDGEGAVTSTRVRCQNVTKDDRSRAVGRLRGSVLLIAAGPAPRASRIAGRDFGARSISTHLEALEAMGARILPGPGHRLEVANGFKPASMYRMKPR
jgi:UDP-N-acetylglucosamine enolpyruvyl transferase